MHSNSDLKPFMKLIENEAIDINVKYKVTELLDDDGFKTEREYIIYLFFPSIIYFSIVI